MDQDDDLYAGLDVAVGAPELEQKLAECQKQLVALQRSLEQAKGDKIELQKANDVLAHNISVLFNTAKAEIDRKNRQIEHLEHELAQRR